MRKLGREPAPAATPRELVTVFELRDEYKEVRGKDIPHNSLVIFDQMFTEYFPVNIEVEYETLYRHLVDALKRSTMQQSTKRKRLQQLRKMLRFAIERGYIEKNPVDTIGIPKLPRKLENKIYTHEEVDAIVEHFFQREGMREYALLYRLLSLSAIRIGEALKLKLVDVSVDAIRIDGKGERRRNFPLDPFPAVRACLDELRTYAKKNRGYVFRWRYASQPQWHLKQAKMRLKMSTTDGRSIHTFRATAEHWWKTEMLIPIETVCKLAGHSMAVHMRDYHATPSARELAEEVRSHVKLPTKKRSRESAKSQPNSTMFHGVLSDSIGIPQRGIIGDSKRKVAKMKKGGE
jgi:integrase